MTTKLQIALAAFALASLMTLAPASALAMRNPGTTRTHTQTSHDRTPVVHDHGSQSRH